jgi:hypothetical protein
MDKETYDELLAHLKFSTDLRKRSEALRVLSHDIRDHSRKVLEEIKKLRAEMKNPAQMFVAFLTNAFLLT